MALPDRQSWVRLLHPTTVHLTRYEQSASGEMVRHDRTTEVTPQLLAALVADTKRLFAAYDKLAGSATPYRPPVLREHERDGERVGTILDVKLADGQLYALTEWSATAWQGVQNGTIRHVSAGWDYDFLLQDGSRYDVVLQEFSITSSPVLKSIGTIQDTLGLQLAEQRAPTKEAPMDPEKVQEMLDALASALEKIAALEAGHAELMDKIAALEGMAMAEDKPAEEEEMAEDEPKGTPSAVGMDPEEFANLLADRIGERFAHLNLSAPKGVPAAPRTNAPKTREQLATQLKAKGLKKDVFVAEYQRLVKLHKL